MKILLLFASILTIFSAIGQTNELVITVKSIGVDDAEGSQAPYINYVDDAGQEQWFVFGLPETGMEEYAEIMVEDKLLIKVSSVYRFGDNPDDKMIDGYEFHEEVAQGLNGKKIRITYDPVGLTAFLYSLEVIEDGTEVDGTIWNSVTIGGQTWMSKNLTKKVFNNGDTIYQAKTEKEWQLCAIKKIPAWCYVDFDESTEDEFGLLYNWYAASDERGLAPEGWRIPSRDDFYSLIQTCGGSVAAGERLKEALVWERIDYSTQSYNTNSSGFTAIPNGSITSGAISSSNPYTSKAGISLSANSSSATFWSKTETEPGNKIESTDAYRLFLDGYKSSSATSLYQSSKGHGYGVRCIQ